MHAGPTLSTGIITLNEADTIQDYNDSISDVLYETIGFDSFSTEPTEETFRQQYSDFAKISIQAWATIS